ncbi:MAG: plastocyanin/azurin family copper-binding protein [Dehalococcoidia bacterium]
MNGIATVGASLLVLLVAAGCTLTAVGGGEEIYIFAGERDGGMYFEPEVITVSAGDQVTFVIKNEGAVDHEFESGEKGEAGVEEIIIPPGRTRRVAWTAPSEPATYTLYCDLPGHRAAGMALTLRVLPVAEP